MTEIVYHEPVRWKHLPWYVKVAVVVAFFDALLYIGAFAFGFFGGL